MSIAAIYILLGSITFVAIHFSTQKIINSLGTRFAIKQALLEKSKLMSQVQRDLTLSLKMANSPLIQQWAGNEGSWEIKQQVMAELESYRQSFEGKSLFIAIANSGHYYFGDGSPSDFTAPKYTLSTGNKNDAWFFRTIDNVESFQLNIDYDNHLDLNKIWYNVVIRAPGKQKIGLCGSGVDITSFINQVIDIDEPGIETILFSSDGTIEGHKNRNYVIHNSKVRGDEKKISIFELLDSEDDRNKTRTALDRLSKGASEVENLSLSLHDQRYLAAISYMAEIDWYNLVLIDAQKVIGFRSFMPILAISVIALLVIVVIISVLMNKLVLSRLSVLSASANRMAQGDFNVSVETYAKDEIGTLTSAFNEMAMMVKDHSENLEQKVIQRTEELKLSHSKLADSNKQIMDSIRYAQLIQTTILPSEEKVRHLIGDFFALYLPRNIVGGDFYFVRAIDDGWILAIIDCTGHGVPGAFMTMTANAVLSNIIDTGETKDPATIIETLNEQFHATLHRNSKDSLIDYGLDIGLCHFKRNDNTLTFSGARIDLHYVVGGNVQMISGQRRSIGYRRRDKHLLLENTTVKVSGDMCCYLTTDGILDQSGGKQGWGFGRRRFKHLLASIAILPLSKQEKKMRKDLAAYQREYPQRDDITVIGFRPTT